MAAVSTSVELATLAAPWGDTSAAVIVTVILVGLPA